MADAIVDPIDDPLLENPFDPLSFPSDLPDFSFDDFSVDDFLDFPEAPPSSSPPCSEGSNSSVPHTLEPTADPDPPQPDARQNPDSPNSGVYAAGSPTDTRNSETTHAEKRKDRGLKRKKGKDEVESSSCLLSGAAEEVEEEEDEKRRMRLMRNRESAQLSRQRKKQYVEELEEKVKSMNSTISDLNNRIAYVMSENASLRQQLAGGKGGVYVPPVAPVPYPWVPYPVRVAGSSQVPLVPIPKLKPSQPPPASGKAKKAEGRTKKVAGVSLLGLLFCVLIVGGSFSGGRFDLFRDRSEGGGIASRSHGRVLMVGGSDGGSLSEKDLGRETVGGSDGGSPRSGNESEPLFASLYVPRNDKLIKIDGNLIISSVLAGESARNQRPSSEGSGKETGVAIRGGASSALAVVKSGKQSHMYSAVANSHKALPSGSSDVYADDWNSASSERLPQDWFREGLEGPIFSSGVCTEVFQFDASQHEGIVPATSVANTTKNATEKPPYPGDKLRNRRILYSQPIQLDGSNSSDSEEVLGAPRSEAGETNSTKSPKSMVVSILMDPRETDDRDNDGRIMPKSVSRIFVVVLVDSVKYITYSCALPFKSSAPHFVVR